MTILTSKQKTAKKDYLGKNCKIFLPLNEGSGSSFTDIAGGIVISGLSVGHTVPNAVTMYGSSITSGIMPTIPAGKNIISFVTNIVNTSSSQNVVSIGTTTTYAIQFSQNGLIAIDGTSYNAAFGGTDVSGESKIRAVTWNGETGEIRSYSGDNGGAVAFRNTVDGSASAGKDIVLPNMLQLGGSAAFIADYYGLALIVTDSLPDDSDLISMLDWTYQQQIIGNKVIHPDFANY